MTSDKPTIDSDDWDDDHIDAMSSLLGGEIEKCLGCGDAPQLDDGCLCGECRENMWEDRHRGDGL